MMMKTVIHTIMALVPQMRVMKKMTMIIGGVNNQGTGQKLLYNAF
jgi:hypothetical protein